MPVTTTPANHRVCGVVAIPGRGTPPGGLARGKAAAAFPLHAFIPQRPVPRRPRSGDYFSTKIDGSADVVRRGADISGEFTGFSDPGPFRIVVTGEHPGSISNVTVRLWPGACTFSKPLSSFTGRGSDEFVADIQLHDLGAGTSARIGHVGRDPSLPVVASDVRSACTFAMSNVV